MWCNVSFLQVKYLFFLRLREKTTFKIIAMQPEGKVSFRLSEKEDLKKKILHWPFYPDPWRWPLNCPLCRPGVILITDRQTNKQTNRTDAEPLRLRVIWGFCTSKLPPLQSLGSSAVEQEGLVLGQLPAAPASWLFSPLITYLTRPLIKIMCIMMWTGGGSASVRLVNRYADSKLESVYPNN